MNKLEQLTDAIQLAVPSIMERQLGHLSEKEYERELTYQAKQRSQKKLNKKIKQKNLNENNKTIY